MYFSLTRYCTCDREKKIVPFRFEQCLMNILFSHVKVLTVEKGKAFSHRKKGWEQFTDAILHALVQMKVRCFVVVVSPILTNF